MGNWKPFKLQRVSSNGESNAWVDSSWGRQNRSSYRDSSSREFTVVESKFEMTIFSSKNNELAPENQFFQR